MYTGSMVGAGAIKFAVMGYVIANFRPDKKLGAVVELNPRLLSAILGEDEAAVVDAIEFLSNPDARSRTKLEGGRRLVRLGEFEYQVVNGAKYRAIRDEESRREQNRAAQEVFRKKKNGWKKFAPSARRTGETMAHKMADAGVSQPEIDAAAATCIPESLQQKPTDDLPSEIQ